MAESLKIKRQTNFSEEEKNLLAQLMQCHPEIEDKRADSQSLHKKKRAWEVIHREFSSSFPGRSFRSLDQLKTFWKRMKIYAKKTADSNRRICNMTGGGMPPASSSPSTEAVISILGDSINPLVNIDDPPSPNELSTNNAIISNNESEPNIPLCIIENDNLILDTQSLPFQCSQNDITAEEQNESVAIETPSLIGCHYRRRTLSRVEETKLKILKETLQTEKIRQETEKIRQEGEKYERETKRLRKWQAMQECLKAPYGLPPDNFQ